MRVINVRNKIFFLKVISGCHEGAILPIETKRLTVGSSAHCDIILSDLQEDKKYLEVVYENKKLFIKAFQDQVFLDGVELIAPSKYISYQPFQLIHFGTCSISIGDKYGEWPKTNPVIITQQKDIFDHTTEKRRYFSSLNILFGSVALLALIGGSFLINQADSVQQGSYQKSALLTVPQLNKKELAEGVVEKILAAFDEYSVKFYIKNNGELAATGFIRNNENWALIRSSILKDIPLVTFVNDSQLKTPEKMLATLNELIASKGLKNKIKVEVDNKGVFITTGAIFDTDTRIWGQLKEDFISSYNTRLSIEDRVSSNKLKLSIRSVNVGKSHYFTSSEGIKYMVGSDLGNDYIVSAIEVDKIILFIDGNSIPIYYSTLENSFVSHKPINP